MAKRIDLNGGGTTPHQNRPSRLNHLQDNLIKTKKTIVLHENPHPIDPLPSPDSEEKSKPFGITRIADIVVPDGYPDLNVEIRFETEEEVSTYLQNHNIPTGYRITIHSGVEQITSALVSGLSKTTYRFPIAELLIDEDATLDQIAPSAFEKCNFLQKLDIRGKCRKIGNKAFNNCWYLSSVNFSNDLEEIGDYAFEECMRGISEIHIPGTCKRIGKYAFHKCEKLSVLELEEGLETIDDYAFWWCYSGIPGDRTGYYERRAYVTGLKNVTIPASVETLGTGVFYCCWYLESVTFLGNKIKRIPDNTFSSCNLKGVFEIPEGVNYIGDTAGSSNTSAFYNNPYLEEIVVPSTCIKIFRYQFITVHPNTVDYASIYTPFERITVHKPENSLEDAPWGAIDATVTWTG